MKRWPNFYDAGSTLYKCYTNYLCLLGCQALAWAARNIFYAIIAKRLFKRIPRNLIIWIISGLNTVDIMSLFTPTIHAQTTVRTTEPPGRILYRHDMNTAFKLYHSHDIHIMLYTFS